MNRMRAVLTAGAATMLSAAAIGATASAQGVIGGGSGSEAESNTQQSDVAGAPVTAQGEPTVIVRELAPIVVQGQAPAASTAVPSAGAPQQAAPTADLDPSPGVSGQNRGDDDRGRDDDRDERFADDDDRRGHGDDDDDDDRGHDDDDDDRDDDRSGHRDGDDDDDDDD